jgi:hypothetical protein
MLHYLAKRPMMHEACFLNQEAAAYHANSAALLTNGKVSSPVASTN